MLNSPDRMYDNQCHFLQIYYDSRSEFSLLDLSSSIPTDFFLVTFKNAVGKNVVSKHNSWLLADFEITF